VDDSLEDLNQDHGCHRCGSLDAEYAFSGYLIIAIEEDGHLKYKYDVKPQIAISEDNVKNKVPFPGYVSLEKKVCVKCGSIQEQINEEDLSLFRDILKYIQNYNEQNFKND